MIASSKFIPALAFGALVLAACNTSQPAATASTSAAPQPAAAAAAGLPSTLPADAVQLTGDEIRTAFANAHESYVSIDNPGVTAGGDWLADTMSADWTYGSESGHVAGTWRIEGDQRCIDFTEGPSGTTECTTVYRHGDGYLSVNPDGSLHGYHENTPL